MCERLKVLPTEGGLLAQDETTIRKLNGILPLLDEWQGELQEKDLKDSQNK